MRYRSEKRPLEGEKITTSSDMAAMEKRSIDEGASGKRYMDIAAEGIYEVVRSVILSDHVLMLCYKGNNSGDAYLTGIHLLDAGFAVEAVQLAPLDEGSSLLQQHAKEFLKKGGIIHTCTTIDEVDIPHESFIIDGLLGTGFKGEVQGLLKEVIEKINQSPNPVLSIDIPSGISGDVGLQEKSSAIFADYTVYLGLLKWGHLFTEAFEHVGELFHVDFGMQAKYIEAIDPFAHVINMDAVKENLPKRPRRANKYSVGQVSIVAGSPSMPGAAILASEAAYRAGAGLVKLFHPAGMESELSSTSPEIIRIPMTKASAERLTTELQRTKCVLLGPGMGRGPDVKERIKDVLAQLRCPVVLDADALFFFEPADAPTVLTPHHGEAKRLFGIKGDISDSELLKKAQEFTDKYEVVLVLKGAPTVVLAPDKPKVVIYDGNPGMATGGTGDVLAGIIAALIAQGMEIREGACLGAAIHALAGNAAKERLSDRSMMATDLIESLPTVFMTLDSE